MFNLESSIARWREQMLAAGIQSPVPLDELERLGAPMPHPASRIITQAERTVRLQNADLEARQKLWRWFIIATLVVLFLETWLAGRTARRLTVQTEAVT